MKKLNVAEIYKELDTFIEYFVENGKYEIEITYFNRKINGLNQLNNGKGKGVDVSDFTNGIKNREFQICDGFWICDEEDLEPKGKFFVMSCINDGITSSGTVPRPYMNDKKGNTVDRMWVDSIADAISICESFLNSKEIENLKELKDMNNSL